MDPQQNKEFSNLLSLYLENRINEEELERLLQLVATMDPAETDRLLEAITSKDWQSFIGQYTDRNWKEKLEQRIAIYQPRERFKWWKYAAAAVLIGVMVLGGFFYLKSPSLTNTGVLTSVDLEAPKSNKARITLGNGKTIYLDSVADGRTIALEDGVLLTKLSDGRIVYSGDAGQVFYNTASNPRGSKVMDLELSDHTHVWLNAGSSITYPVTFIEKQRKVSISGEAYFEVAHDASKPFVVSNGNTAVTVLGTHFNVKGYDNEPGLAVTLLEGKVKVNTVSSEKLLAPGEQAFVARELISINHDVNIEDVMAWKNGFTSFHGADMKEILRELERWYDITTEMKGEIETMRMIDVPRTVALKDVLKSLLDDNGIKYEYDAANKKLTIKP